MLLAFFKNGLWRHGQLRRYHFLRPCKVVDGLWTSYDLIDFDVVGVLEPIMQGLNGHGAFINLDPIVGSERVWNAFDRLAFFRLMRLVLDHFAILAEHDPWQGQVDV